MRLTFQKSFTKPERYILCPACGKEDFRVDHLDVGTKTAWYCDGCEAHFRLHILPHGCVELEVMEGESKAKRIVTLRSSGPVTLLLNRFSILPDDDEEGHARYYYDEHTCPTNFMGDVAKVIDEHGDEDPHGVFAFVKIEPGEIID